jgi:hypothetical protein
MTDTLQNDAPNTSESSQSKIPIAAAEELRHLSHELSNALEVVLQTNYLLGMTAEGVNEDSRKWRAMLDQGVMQASQINRQLRDYLRAHS